MIRKSLLAFFCIQLLFTFVSAQQKKRKIRSIPTVNFCNLTINPQRYLHKLIRTEASYIVWWESSYLYSNSCKNHKRKISNEFDCDDGDKECFARMSREWEKLDPYLLGKAGSDAQRVKAVFIGRLNGPDAFGHLGSFEFEFRIRKIEKIRAIPKSISWKGL